MFFISRKCTVHEETDNGEFKENLLIMKRLVLKVKIGILMENHLIMKYHVILLH